MALILADRVKESTTTTGTSDFALGGAVTGFQTFAAGVGANNTTYYAIADGADWEIGLGTLSSDGLTLARTTVYQSSNSDSKVLFASGSKHLFVTYAADKAVFEDASGNVTLPANLTVTGGSTTDSVQLDLTAGVTPAVGQIAWDANQGTASLGLLGGNIISRIGQSLVAYVTNAESVTITKGQAVYLFSAQGDRATVKLAYNTGDATSAKTLGIVGEDITANGTGFVVCQGVAYGLDLSAFTAGDTVYLGATAGSITATKPYAPNHLVYLGVVEKANAGAGQLYVRVQNGYELDEIHNVSAQSPSNEQTIVYNSSTSLWEKNTVSLTAGVRGTLPVANGGTGITSFGSGVATFLGTPSSANLAAAVTDETGTGALVFANSPTLVTPALGTPSALVGTNITGTAANFNINGTVGATSPTTGAFTTLSASSTLSVTGAGSIQGLTVGRGAGAVSTNTAVGSSALDANTTGASNTGLGYQALLANTDGAQNTAVGRAALTANTSGALNSAFGRSALLANTTGGNNTAIGGSALASNTTASNNVAVGYQAGYLNTTGTYNLFLGYQAGYANQTGIRTTFVGYAAGYANTADQNTAVGYSALSSNSTGALNSAFGDTSLYANTTGSYNTAVGMGSLRFNTTASNNTAVGYQAAYSNTTGYSNTIVGRTAGYNITTGYDNTFIGQGAGYSVTTGSLNTFIGSNSATYSSGQNITTGSKNSILGNYNGNQGGLDIRTASNNIVLSDGDGNVGARYDKSGSGLWDFFQKPIGTQTASNWNTGQTKTVWSCDTANSRGGQMVLIAVQFESTGNYALALASCRSNTNASITVIVSNSQIGFAVSGTTITVTNNAGYALSGFATVTALG